MDASAAREKEPAEELAGIVKTGLASTTVKHELEVTLTEAERAAMGHSASELHIKTEDLKAKLKEYSSVRRKEIKSLESQMMHKALCCSTGKERRFVECEQFANIETGESWYFYRGEKYPRENLTAYELAQWKQRGVFGDYPGVPGVVRIDGGGEELAAHDEDLLEPPMKDLTGELEEDEEEDEEEGSLDDDQEVDE